MSFIKILKYPDSKLHKMCTRVRQKTNFKEVQQLIDRMFKSMYFHGGIGLAAPQVGVSLRVIVLDIGNGHKYSMINPIILQKEGKTDFEEECLSFPGITTFVSRYNRIEVCFLDYNGEKQTIEAKNLLSATIQHEIDHLYGILLIDRVSKLQKDRIIKKMRKKYCF